MNTTEVVTLAAGLIVELAKLITEAHRGNVPSTEVLTSLKTATDQMAANRKAIDAQLDALGKTP